MGVWTCEETADDGTVDGTADRVTTGIARSASHRARRQSARTEDGIKLSAERAMVMAEASVAKGVSPRRES